MHTASIKQVGIEPVTVALWLICSLLCVWINPVSPTDFVPLLIFHFTITIWKKKHFLQSCFVSSNLTTPSVCKLFVQRKTKPETAISLLLLPLTVIFADSTVLTGRHAATPKIRETLVLSTSRLWFSLFFFPLGPWSQPCWGPLKGRREQQDSPESKPLGPGIWPYGHHFRYPPCCMVVFLVIEFFTISFFSL